MDALKKNKIQINKGQEIDRLEKISQNIALRIVQL